jgi:plastocyanin
VEAAAHDEPAEAPVAEETPAATEEVQAPQVPQEQAPPPAEPAQPAAATAPAQPAAVAAAAPAEAKAGGVIHGTATGTRVRPEDATTTEAQYQGQMDMYARRKLIDELVGTGVPVVSAADTGQQRSPALALMYLLIPIMAIAFLLANNDSTPAAAEGEHGGGEAAAGGITLTAANFQFETDQLSWAADEETTVTFTNDDSAEHNFSIYTDDTATEDLFLGQNVPGGSSTDYVVDPLEAGEYFFRCDLHPTSMTGTVTIE